MEKNISYSEDAKGWVTFNSFIPDWLTSINNRFYSIKNGQLYVQDDVDNPIMNNFYGVQYTSKVKTIINDENATDKIFKTIELEGSHAWELAIRTNLANSTIKASEFKKKESKWFAYIRKNESATDMHGLSTQGIGVIVSSASTVITFANLPLLINVGDALYQLNGSVQELIGTIVSYTNTTITVNAITTTPVNGYFSFAKKNTRIEGGEIRGYFAELSLENNDTEAVELFGVSSEIVKSGV